RSLARSWPVLAGPGRLVRTPPGRSAVAAGIDDTGIVEKVGSGVVPIPGDVEVRGGAQDEVTTEEWPEGRLEVQIAGGVGPEEADEGLGYDPAAHWPQVLSVVDDLGLSQDVVPQRSAVAKRPVDAGDRGKLATGKRLGTHELGDRLPGRQPP